MKIRWTQNSVRFRITPPELAAIERGESISETLQLPGGVAWSAAITPATANTSLRFESGALCLSLGEADRQRLSTPENEGVYFQEQGEPALRYFIEKDFPCAHPRAADALEPPTETFMPPAGFEERKQQ
ncbi:MAG TPA: hypothetical protein VF600_17070 [Abditibacteriaceae bacterium]|jgi:hypothetical protein